MKVNVSFGDDEENITEMENTIRKMALRAEGIDTGSASSSDSDSDFVADSEKKMKAKKNSAVEPVRDNIRAYNVIKRTSLVMGQDERPKTRMKSSEDKFTKNPPPEFRMDRNITTIKELWREWYIGSRRVPSVEVLEQMYGCNWRKEEKDRIWFSKRKTAIRVVHDVADKNEITKEQAINDIDAFLKDNEKTINFVAQKPKIVLAALTGYA